MLSFAVPMVSVPPLPDRRTCAEAGRDLVRAATPSGSRRDRFASVGSVSVATSIGVGEGGRAG